MLVLILLIWSVGALLRLYAQARFYQIEEYKSGRYVRWLFTQRPHSLPTRSLIATFIGLAISIMLSEAPGSSFPGVILAVAAVIAVWPAQPTEIKKAFRRTGRATRILATAGMFVALIFLLAIIGLTALNIQRPALRFGLGAIIGFLLFIVAPFLLIIGNWLMTPVEAFVRRRFLRRARHILEEIRPTVIGITGSYGKTSTKTYLTQILDGRYRALPTPKSYNTLMGISLVINNTLANDYGIDYFIAEMGAYVEGEIAEICDLTRPATGIIVDVGPQHLERFGSLENIANAKYELIAALPPDGIAIFNWDSPHVRNMYERDYPETRIAVSKTVSPEEPIEGGPRFIASQIRQSLEGLTFKVTDKQTREEELFSTPLLGQHNITNILLATAVAVHEKMSLRDIARIVRLLQPAESRLVRQTTPEGITIINDAYSANPIGAAQALEVLGLHGGKRLLVTPGMVELGPLMDSENRKLGMLAARHASDVILIGAQQTKAIKSGLLDCGFPARHLLTVETLTESIDWYKKHLRAGDAVLFLNDLPDTY